MHCFDLWSQKKCKHGEIKSCEKKQWYILYVWLPGSLYINANADFTYKCAIIGWMIWLKWGLIWNHHTLCSLLYLFQEYRYLTRCRWSCFITSLDHRKVIEDHEIDLLHKFHIGPVPYKKMHHFVTKMCMSAHFCYKLVHCKIFD